MISQCSTSLGSSLVSLTYSAPASSQGPPHHSPPAGYLSTWLSPSLKHAVAFLDPLQAAIIAESITTRLPCSTVYVPEGTVAATTVIASSDVTSHMTPTVARTPRAHSLCDTIVQLLQ